MPVSKKIETLSQETFRRLHNTKHEIKWDVKVKILEKFMSELMFCGYSEYDRYQILKSGYQRYQKLRLKEDKGERPFFRSRTFNANDRIEEKEKKKTFLVQR